jgi:DNA-binding NtrC family response regulator
MTSTRILLIDQHVAWLRFAEETLSQADYDVTTALDLDEVCERCINEDFDLILIGLPQVERHLSKLSDLAKNPGHPLRFVVMFPVRQTFDTVRMMFKEAGAHDVVDKPYQPDVLLRMVANEVYEARRQNNLAAAHNL